jgi:hypothetical protein
MALLELLTDSPLLAVQRTVMYRKVPLTRCDSLFVRA